MAVEKLETAYSKASMVDQVCLCVWACMQACMHVRACVCVRVSGIARALPLNLSDFSPVPA